MYRPNFLIGLIKQLEETCDELDKADNVEATQFAAELRHRFQRALEDLGIIDSAEAEDEEDDPAEPLPASLESAPDGRTDRVGQRRARSLAGRALGAGLVVQRGTKP